MPKKPSDRLQGIIARHHASTEAALHAKEQREQLEREQSKIKRGIAAKWREVLQRLDKILQDINDELKPNGLAISKEHAGRESLSGEDLAGMALVLERKGHTAVANRQRLEIVVMRNGDVVPRYVGILPIAPEPKQFSLSDTADEMLQDMIETFLDRAVK